MNYCQVLNSQPQAPQPLPQAWANVSNFPSLSDGELAGYGWYRFVESIQPNYNPATQRLVQELQFTGMLVNQVWTVVALTPDERMAYLLQQKTRLEGVVKNYLDDQVKGRDYKEGLDKCTTWINSTDPAWASDARDAVAFRDRCWKILYAIQDEVVAGLRPLPTDAELLAALPTLWPILPPAPPDNGGGNGNGTFTG